jgi:undecaprenyl phosphate-alpha-L-ara4N flippase subunit ArnE
LLKKSQSLNGSDDVLNLFLNFYFLLGVGFYGVSVILFAKSLRRLPVSVAHPVSAGLSFLFLVIVARIFLDEKLFLHQLVGCVLVIIGIFLLGKQ